MIVLCTNIYCCCCNATRRQLVCHVAIAVVDSWSWIQLNLSQRYILGNWIYFINYCVSDEYLMMFPSCFWVLTEEKANFQRGWMKLMKRCCCSWWFAHGVTCVVAALWWRTSDRHGETQRVHDGVLSRKGSCKTWLISTCPGCNCP